MEAAGRVSRRVWGGGPPRPASTSGQRWSRPGLRPTSGEIRACGRALLQAGRSLVDGLAVLRGSSVPARALGVVVALVWVACDATLEEPASDRAARDPTSGPGASPSQPGPVDACAGVDFDPGPTLVRRLTPWEYANVVQTVFEVDLAEDIRELWPPRARLHGLSNAAETQVATLTHVQAFQAVAERVAEAVDAEARWASCGARSDPECSLWLVKELGEPLFRREVGAVEATRWAELVAEAPTRPEGLRWLVRAMLQSGSFLYRVETEPSGTDLAPVSPRDLAVRLAFLAWGQGPDEGLLRAADRGELDTEEGLRRGLDRLLADPRAEAHALELATDWLGIASVERSNVASAFSGVDEALLEDMKAEVHALVRRVWWTEDQPLSALFTASRGTLTGRLAAWYGLAASGDAAAEYDLPAPRAGVLTQGAVLAQAAGAEASMIARGLYILENVLCQELPPPPANLDISDDGRAETFTEREASEVRLSREQCAGCHGGMEPLAHAFEPFDGAGRYRTRNDEGYPMRSEGSMTLLSGETLEWRTADEFVRALVDTDAAKRCLVEKPLAFSLGRPLRDRGSDACAVQQIKARYLENGGSYRALVRAIAAHPIFRMMRPLETED